MIKYLRILALRWRIGDLEASVETHQALAEDHRISHALAVRDLRKAKAELALLDCPARALRVVKG